MLKTPVLFIIFNRPDTTQEVFEVIRKAMPERLYVAADGPRFAKEDEIDKCKQTKAVIESINWPCEVKKLYRDQNLGCKIAVSSAIDWFFENEEEGIILEDDCVPDVSFFSYCEALLQTYRHDTRVMHISGTNFLFREPKTVYSYHFSKYVSIWGWASWRRAWKLYDPDLKNWPEYKREGLLANILQDEVENEYFTGIFDMLYAKKFDTWDLQWFYCVFFQHGLAVAPSRNLVKNIGFRPDATHTHSESKLSNLKQEQILKIHHPPYMLVDIESDAINFNVSFSGYDIRRYKTLSYKLNFLGERAFKKIKRILGFNK